MPRMPGALQALDGDHDGDQGFESLQRTIDYAAQPAGNEQILMGRERVITPLLEEDKVTASPDQPWPLTRPMIRANGIHGVGFGGRFASASCSGRHSDFRSIQRRTDAARTIKETGPCERITS